FGKLPGPIADQKAAIRYLRYKTNAELIPGDKDRIFVTGFSSGGCSGTVIGASGNHPLFAPFLEEIGAAPTSDEVYGVIAGCPIITRDWSDNGSFWLRFGAYLNDPDIPAYCQLLLSTFDEYQKGLGIYAMVDGESEWLADYETYADYMWQYIKKSIITYLNQISQYGTNMALNGGTYGAFTGFPAGGTHTTGKDAIDLYLSTSKPADALFGTPIIPRNWIKPIYDPDDDGLVVDLDNTFADYITIYLAPGRSVMDVSRPMTDNAFWFGENLTADGTLKNNANANAASATTQSMGKADDYGAVFSDLGWRYIEENFDIVVSDAYKAFLTMQRNSVDPVYFTLGDGKDEADTAKYWFLRNGAGDGACILPLMFNLAESLRMRGIYTDVGVNWDRGHEYVSDVNAAWEFAKLAAAGALTAAPTPLPDTDLLKALLADYNQAYADFCYCYDTTDWRFRRELFTDYTDESVLIAEAIMNAGGGLHAELLAEYGKLEAGRFDKYDGEEAIIAGTDILNGAIADAIMNLVLKEVPVLSANVYDLGDFFRVWLSFPYMIEDISAIDQDGEAVAFDGVILEGVKTWVEGGGYTGEYSYIDAFKTNDWQAICIRFAGQELVVSLENDLYGAPIWITDVTAEASVEKQNGSKNKLTVTVTMHWSNGTTTKSIDSFSIDNNSEGTFTVGDYQVYADTKGNDKIRACYIVED
ncbi:MAG: hypothetical protein LBH09_02425, partial [Peptococcaceae bacterium]|nr:hypothetical protein [Peptococcaceae bacterium]